MAAPSFSASVNVASDGLTIAYKIVNDGSSDLGVFNKIRSARIDGTSDFSAAHCYIDRIEETRTLRVLKIALPVPDGLQMGGYPVPDASRLAAGATLAEQFTLPAPFRVCHPFKRAMIRGEVIADRCVEVDAVELCVGVFECGADVQLASEHPAFPDVLTPRPPSPAIARQTILSRRFLLASPLSVLEYRGVAW